MKMQLEAHGYEVITAYDGEEALRKVRMDNPDLIILDLMLPAMSGYMICSLLKNDERFSKTPIVLCSARTQEEDVELGDIVLDSSFGWARHIGTAEYPGGTVEIVGYLLDPGSDPSYQDQTINFLIALKEAETEAKPGLGLVFTVPHMGEKACLDGAYKEKP